MLVVVALLLLLFGSSRIPKLARSMGQSVLEFRTGLKDHTPSGRQSGNDKETGLM
jgi:TatA/E family protein of Tat protein translocase